MTKRPPLHIVKSHKGLKALVSAARLEVADALAEMGTVSVAALAATLGRPADALYFHLRALVRAGLARQAGYRLRGQRKEALFETVADELKLDYRQPLKANRNAVSAIVASMLRLGIRDFRRAFQEAGGGTIVVSGPRRELWALRKAGRLSPAKVRRINRSIHGLLRAMAKPNGKGRLYAITVLLTPVDRQRKSAKGLGRKGKKT